MKKIFAALMIAAAIAAFVLPKAQTYAAESADDYVAVKMESDCENFTFSGFSVIPNDNASKFAHRITENPVAKRAAFFRADLPAEK